MIGASSDLAAAAVDATGLESRRVSAYYGRRTGRRFHRFPKVSQVVDTKTHLCLAAVVGRGPSPDNLQPHAAARQAHGRHRFRALAGGPAYDLAYDAERHHRYLWDRPHVLGVIPPRRGRPPRSAERHEPPTFFRRFRHEHWAAARPPPLRPAVAGRDAVLARWRSGCSAPPSAPAAGRHRTARPTCGASRSTS